MDMGSLGEIKMHSVLFFIWLLSGIVAIWLQFKYRDANYPMTIQWRLLLFLSGFLNGLFGALLFTVDSELKVRLLVSLFIGVFGGMIFTFGFPRQMRGLFPK
jgi:RsiW-degrading membrane proteinase PrsW (M82 family)